MWVQGVACLLPSARGWVLRASLLLVLSPEGSPPPLTRVPVVLGPVGRQQLRGGRGHRIVGVRCRRGPVLQGESRAGEGVQTQLRGPEGGRGSVLDEGAEPGVAGRQRPRGRSSRLAQDLRFSPGVRAGLWGLSADEGHV